MNNFLSEYEIERLYQKYLNTSIVFDKEVIKNFGLNTKQICIKYKGIQLPCFIYSCSMKGAKIITNLDNIGYKEIKKGNNVNLRFYFKREDENNPIIFFINSKITGFTPYKSKENNLTFISITFNQKPPVELIHNIGELIEAKQYFSKRKETRINITPLALKRLDLKSKMAAAEINNVKIKCVLSDISFSGAKIVINKFINVNDSINIYVQSETNLIKITGKVIRIENLENLENIYVSSIIFNEKEIPISYKILISEYFKNYNKFLVKN